MTSKDKTREKLVGSMRKTKTVTGSGSDGERTETGADAAVSEATEIKAETPSETTAKPAPKTTTKTTTKTSMKTTAKAKPKAERDGHVDSTSQPARAGEDSYQSGRRVWPD
jgi:hypothetical protein